MRRLIFGFLAVLLVINLFSLVEAATIGTPSISSPSSGSSFSVGSTFTLTASISCTSGNCKSIQLTANLPSGLSTSSANPQSCGSVGDEDPPCSKSWTISANSAGSYSITVSVSTSNAGSSTSSAISVSVTSPSCSISASPSSLQTGQSSTITVSYSNLLSPPSTVSVNCGNGDTATASGCTGTSGSCSTTCSYSTAAAYTVSASASGTSCSSATVTVSSTTTTTTEAPAGTLSIQLLSPTENQTFKRGDFVNVKIKLTSAGSDVTDADVQAEMFGKIVKLRDDGLHGDENTNDGIYGENVQVRSFDNGSYPIVISASKSGYTSASPVKVNFFVFPEIKVEPKIEEEVSKGENLIITGSVKDSVGNIVESGTTQISFEFENWKFESNTSVANGTFSYQYPVSFVDFDGKWKVNITVVDKFNNYGYVIIPVNVKTPPAGAFYYVKFISPVAGISYSRGERLLIAVEITEAGKMISGANVTAKTSRGSTIDLQETIPGTYTGEYFISFEDPTGNYSINVVGTKISENQTRGGGGKLTVDLRPAILKLELLSPDKRDFVVGESVKIISRILYPDGKLGQNIVLEASSPAGDKISFEEKEPGVYQAEHKLKDADEGSWILELRATDKFGNNGVLRETFNVGPITVFYLILQFWYLVLIAASPFAYFGYKYSAKQFSRNQFKRLVDEQKRIIEMKKQAQIKYYKKGSIDKETYEDLMKQYEQKENDVKSKLKKLREESKRQKKKK